MNDLKQCFESHDGKLSIQTGVALYILLSLSTSTQFAVSIQIRPPFHVFLHSNSVTREYFNYLPTERTIQNEVHQTQATLKWRQTPVSYPNSNFLCYRPSQLLLITSTKSVLSCNFINHQSRSQAKVKVQLISRGRERITQHTCITFDFEKNVPSTGFSFNFLIFCEIASLK